MLRVRGSEEGTHTHPLLLTHIETHTQTDKWPIVHTDKHINTVVDQSDTHFNTHTHSPGLWTDHSRIHL